MDLTQQVSAMEVSGGNTITTIPGTGNQNIPADAKVVENGKVVKLDYVGRLENGTVFDTSIEDEAKAAGILNTLRDYIPLSFVPGNGQMIPGFENGVLGMKVGERKTVTVLPQDGYTSGPYAGMTLIFDVMIREVSDPAKLNVIVVNDKRCDECDVLPVMEQLKMVFAGMEYVEIDYGTGEGKKLYAESNLKYLPAILFDDAVEDAEGYDNVEPYLEPAGSYLSLRIGAEFDPNAEICDNKADDNGDGLIDCADPTCAKAYACMAKLDKPKVELFVMSHCPYGTQIEKGIVPVLDILGDKVDFAVKFCTYAMHGKTELDEELAQHCIQTEFNDKYPAYLKCFLADGDGEACVKTVGIDESKLDACIAATDEEYKVTEQYNDKSTWLSGYYPVFDVYKDDNEKYDIQGSPGFVVNGVVVERAGRDPQSLLDAICIGFAEEPAECGEALSSETPSAGFGLEGGAGASDAGGCGA
ncbi:MAG: FKBP-type peptidyl-prolyl cis-trans isomerase [Candidatus Altiarchaeota archaeon]|nr:FKBP-type peptidyl-prolyl cis-trans isomerase [Candidatus Altiarchaeota archaeon]